MAQLYPLRFKEILRDYRFGNRWIAKHFRKQGLPDNHRIGETWEVCDRPGESSILCNGPLEGKSLRQLIEQYDQELLGRDIVSRFGLRFPLLIKFLDASNVLGEQVHDNDELARRKGLDDPGKTEAWYMLDVKDAATVECGSRDGITRADIIQALLDGNIRSCMKEYSVKPADTFLLHAGAMHYSPGGLLFYEIMQNSDVYVGLGKIADDLEGSERRKIAIETAEAVHLEDGCDFKTRPVTLTDGVNKRTFLAVCEHFALERLDLAAPYQLNCDGARFYIVSQIEGESSIGHGRRSETLLAGNSCMLPGCLGQVTIEPSGNATILKAYVPDLVKDVIEPLRREGIPAGDIVALGGKTRLNPLSRLLP